MGTPEIMLTFKKKFKYWRIKKAVCYSTVCHLFDDFCIMWETSFYSFCIGLVFILQGKIHKRNVCGRVNDLVYGCLGVRIVPPLRIG